MAVMAIFTVKGETRELLERYDRALPRIIEVSPDKPLSHVCAGAADGLRIVDVWESEAALERFAGNPKFQEALREAGLPAPEVAVFPVHKTSW